MLPIGVLIAVEQVAVAPIPSAALAAGFAALLLLTQWLMAWHPTISALRWIEPLGDAKC